MDWLWSLRTPIMWVAILGGAIMLVLIGSGVRVPGLERKIAVSEETRNAAATPRAPTLTRAQAIDKVRQFIRAECADGESYLQTDPPFEAVFMATPFTNDHHERGVMEWTIDDPLTGAKWRYYEPTGETISVLGDC